MPNPASRKAGLEPVGFKILALNQCLYGFYDGCGI